MNEKTFADRLRWVRKDLARMTLQEFAQAVGYKAGGYISDLERGVKEKPSLELLQRIADQFGVNFLWIHEGRGERLASAPPTTTPVAPETDIRIQETVPPLGMRRANVLSAFTYIELGRIIDSIMRNERIPPDERFELARPFFDAQRHIPKP